MNVERGVRNGLGITTGLGGFDSTARAAAGRRTCAKRTVRDAASVDGAGSATREVIPILFLSKWLVVAAAMGAGALSASADVIELKDGRSISGSIARQGDLMLIQPDGAALITTTPDQVVRVTLVNSLTPAQLANAEWSRTAAQIKKADDLATIVTLHEKFLEKYPDQEISAGVRTSLGEYQKLERQKAVKFRGRWMPAAQVDVTIRNWQDQARPVVALYRSGQLREAFEAAKQIVQADEENPVALTIAGMAAFRLNNLGSSRLYFGKLAAADPSSPLAENNLAVIAAQQRLFAEGLIHYTRALESGPGNRLLLDNIEEALFAYLSAGGDKNGSAYRDLTRQFDQAESRMEADMAKKDLYRYGSTWVGKEEFSRLGSSRASILAAMKELDGQYNSARQSFGLLGDQIAQAANDYNAALSDINSLNSLIQGGQYGNPDVPGYMARRDTLIQNLDAIRNRKQALEAQRDQLTITVGTMYAQADKLKSALAQADGAQFSGVQRMMELGEDQDPPGPAPLPAAPRVAIAPILAPPPPVAPSQTYQNQVLDSYSIISTPIGLPFFPTFPVRPPHQGPPGGHDHDHDHDHDGPPGHDKPPPIDKPPGGGPIVRPLDSGATNAPTPDTGR